MVEAEGRVGGGSLVLIHRKSYLSQKGDRDLFRMVELKYRNGSRTVITIRMILGDCVVR